MTIPHYQILTVFSLLAAVTLAFLWMRAIQQLTEISGKYDLATTHAAGLSDELETVQADNAQLVADVQENAAKAHKWQVSANTNAEMVSKVADRAIAFSRGDRVKWHHGGKGGKTLEGNVCAIFPPGADIVPPDEYQGAAVNLIGRNLTKRHDTLPAVLVAVKNGDQADIYRPLLTMLKPARR